MITSTGNPTVKAARQLARRRARSEQGRFLVEGPQAVAEAGAHLTRLFVTGEAAARHAEVIAACDAEVLTVSERVLAVLADTVEPQGIVGVAELPAVTLDAALEGAGLVVALWEVADPGNLGAVVRTADAAGADAVVCTSGSADPRGPKAVRAAAGSLFHLPVVTADGAELLAAARGRGLQLVAADAAGPTPHTAVDLARPSLLVFGNEAHGLDAAALAACDVVTAVPIATPQRPGYRGHAESLNLAASVAVVAYEAARQRSVAAAAG